jgi:excisionase family DNA binding protein
MRNRQMGTGQSPTSDHSGAAWEPVVRKFEEAKERRWLLKPEEAADVLNVSRSTVYNLMAAGLLRSITICRSRRIPVDALREWVNQQKA